MRKHDKKPGHIQKACNMIRTNFVSLFTFEIFYKAITFLVFTPLMRQVISLDLKLSGVTNLSDDNLRKVLTFPLTWIFTILLLYLLAAFISLELAGLINALHASAEGIHLKLSDIFNDGIADTGRIFKPCNFFLLIYILLILPFSNLPTFVDLTQNFAVPDFIMEVIDENLCYRILYYCVLYFIAYLAIRWLLIIPAMAIRDENFIDAARESAHLMKKHGIKECFRFVLLIVFAVFFLLASMLLLSFAFWLILWPFQHFGLFTLPLINIFFAAGMVVAVIAFPLITPFIFAEVYIAYEEYTALLGTHIPGYQKSELWIQHHRYVRYILSAILIAAIFISLPARVHEIRLTVLHYATPTMVMAHRGDSVNAPENTLPAFQSAIDNGADAIELDVQMTKDGTIVVLHDSSIDRTTGQHGNIWDLTYDDIKDLDNGSFFSPAFSDTHIPTLDQVLKLCKDQLYLNIEIKRTGHDEGITQKVVQIIKDNQFENECDITSMDYDTLLEVRAADPVITTVYTTIVAYGDVSDLSAADIFSVEGSFVNRSFVSYLRQNGKGIYVWTINNEEQMQELAQLHVDAIITNDPVTCRKTVDSAKPFIEKKLLRQ